MDEEPDFLEQEIAERTAKDPNYPRLLADAEAALAEQRRMRRDSDGD